ncbi:hypothetical protein [Lysobacter sp. GCM10012299]|uniref:hypothetical protein n=1 Tax=Lysobacter sp. GCM10012299 TaxID=3317333 RepID=UPI00361E25E5
MEWFKHRWLGVALMMWALSATASSRDEVRKQAEISMLVAGSINIEADGSVSAHRLDQKGELPDGVVRLIDAAIVGWRFEPIVENGRTVAARAPMSLRLVARGVGADDYAVRIASARFGEEREGEFVTTNGKLAAPKYPEEAVRYGVGGTVYLVLQIGRNGKPIQVIAEQVNLTAVDDERGMRRWREMLGRTAVQTARRWQFDLPTSGPEVDAPYWSLRVPVDFVPPDQEGPKHGEWRAYIPGSKEQIPWKLRTDDNAIGADAFVTNGIYPIGKGPRLLTPLESS